MTPLDYALAREREDENFVRDAVNECKRQFGKVAEIKVKRDDASSSIIITAVATGRKLEITDSGSETSGNETTMTDSEKSAFGNQRVPRCPECGTLMQPLSYGWWHCPTHPLQLVPDQNLPDYDRLRGR